MDLAEPKHVQLRTHLAQSIQDGTLEGGEFLPSEPALAKEFLVSRGTVRQALAELQNDGLIERIPGKGTVVVRVPSESSLPVPCTDTVLNLFAIVLPELGTGHYPALVQGFDESAGKVHHQTMVCVTGNDLRRQGDIVLQLIDKQVAGVALAPPTAGGAPAHHIRQLHNHGIPLVLLHRGIDGLSVPVVALPYAKIAQMAAEQLLERGHRRVAYFASHRGNASEIYENSFRDTMEQGGGALLDECIHYGSGPPKRATVFPSPQRVAEVQTELKRLIRLPMERRPTAIFDPWDADAETIYLSAVKEGLSIPRDLSIVGFGGASRAGSLSTNMSKVVIDELVFADQVVELLIQMRKGNEPLSSNRRREVSATFFVGNTIKSLMGQVDDKLT
ncbi:GntR family transcriptional regulator [Aeoliella sp.]|uniref:GntR family transcriptional regulator n=1 Tax=Aeoliella sp. TaxID=2795800 RepID=UPI003CCBE36B